jgi:hypothetical protein
MCDLNLHTMQGHKSINTMPKWLWNSPPHRSVGDLAAHGSPQNLEINHHPRTLSDSTAPARICRAQRLILWMNRSKKKGWPCHTMHEFMQHGNNPNANQISYWRTSKTLKNSLPITKLRNVLLSVWIYIKIDIDGLTCLREPPSPGMKKKRMLQSLMRCSYWSIFFPPSW